MDCLQCKKHFVSSNDFLFHIGYVHKIESYVCQYCKRTYDRKDNFKTHLLDKHNIPKNSPRQDSRFIDKKSSDYRSNSMHGTCESDSQKDVCASEVGQKITADPLDDMKSFHSDFQKLYEESVKKFITNLHGDLNINRTQIQSIIDGVSKFLSSGMLEIVKKCVSSSVKEDIYMKIIYDMLTKLENPFEHFKSEYKRFKYFEGSNCLIKPVSVTLGASTERKRKRNEVFMHLTNKVAIFVPMSKTLRLFLEIPGVHESISNYQSILMKSNNSESTHNIVQGSVWKKMCLNSDESEILPLLIYFDDFEPLNALGSHAGAYKIGAIYFTIATIPPQYAARLENIFLAMLFHSTDRSEFGNRKTFNIILEELKSLETDGITVNIDGIERIIKFKVAVLCGDNLGLHSIIGFNESFSTTHYCRFCCSVKVDMSRQTHEIQNLRKRADYKEHFDNNIGIKELCVWNELQSFHIYDNVACDVMHDLFEGVHRYDMALIIKYLIQEKCFTLEDLNNRIKFLSYENYERNIPPGIKKDHISNGCIILSASEMLCFVRNFRFIIGDLVPENNEIWSFYLILLEITDLLTSNTISIKSLELLDNLIKQHHELFLKLFDCNLKPKHHFLIHYPTLIRKIGPPVCISSMRFEAKHKEFKNTATSIRCRINLPYSLTLKSQLKECYRFMSGKGLDDKISHGPVHYIEYDNSVFKMKKIDENSYFGVEWYEINGIKYEQKSVVLYKYEYDIPIFFRIKGIFIHKLMNHDVYFFGQLLSTIGFNEHLKAFQVEKHCTANAMLLGINDISDFLPTISHKMNDESYYVGIR